MLVFIDESGCLGFNWDKPGTSKYLILTALVCCNGRSQTMFKTAVKRVLRNKINRKSRKKPKNEIKGSETPFKTKQYFYQQLDPRLDWTIYSVTLNKRRVYGNLQGKNAKHRLYNFMVKFLVDQIPISSDVNDVTIIVDKSKNQNQVKDFNKYILWSFENKTTLNCNIHLYHPASHENAGLQAVDLFCWGIARKHENDFQWYNVFKNKIRFDEIYLP